jgi:ABC-2 type transport system ATP-binding protein
VLEARAISKRFGDLVAVDGLTLEIREGEVFGLLGPNGAGKTTSISMMCGLLRADGGEILIRGQPITGGAPDVRARVGVCPQQIVVWKQLTCLEQLVFVGEMYGVAPAVARERADGLLAAMGLTDKRRAVASTLSGGMQRRLNLLLALIHDPEIIALDEPEAGLDPQSRVLVREYIQSLAHKKTVILTTHNMDEAERVADRVAIVDHGKLLALDTPDALKQRVGPGDVLELTVAGDDAAADALAPAVAAVRSRVDAVAVDGGTLILRAPALVERIPGLLEALGAAGFPPRELRLRENTLEDVFLALTGRRLRE